MKTAVAVKSLSLISTRPIVLFHAGFGNSLSLHKMDHIASFTHMILTRANPMRVAANSDTVRFFLRMPDKKDPLRTLIEKSVVHHHHWYTERILKEYSRETGKSVDRQTSKQIIKVRDLLQEPAYHEIPASKIASQVEKASEQSHTDTNMSREFLHQKIIQRSTKSGTAKPKKYSNRLMHKPWKNKPDETATVSKQTQSSNQKPAKGIDRQREKTTDRPVQKHLRRLDPKQTEVTHISEQTDTDAPMSTLHQKIIERSKKSSVTKPKEHANQLIHKSWSKISNKTVTADKQAKISDQKPDQNAIEQMNSSMENRTGSSHSLNEVTTRHLYSSRHLERLTHNHSHKMDDKKVFITPSYAPLKKDAAALKKVQTQHAETASEHHRIFNKPVEITYKKERSTGTTSEAFRTDTVQNDAHDVSSDDSPHGLTSLNGNVELIANHTSTLVMKTIEQGTLDIISRKVMAQVEAMWDREIMRRGGNHGI